MANKPLNSIQFPNLSDTYTIPQIDDTLSVAGKAADAAAVGEELSDLRSAFDLDSLTPGVKSALLNLLEHVAYIDEDGQDYYDALYDALYNRYWEVTNNLTNCTTSNASEQTLKSGAYSATITASTSYVMTGATVSITMGGTDITATAYSNGVVSIPAVTGALVITISAAAKTVSSISAVYTQSGTVYDTDSLDSLKSDLMVTATFSDSSSATVPAADYTLSGTLTAGTSTVTVTFGGKTTTFTVTVTANAVILKGYTIAQKGASGSADLGIGANNARAGYVYAAGEHPYRKDSNVTLTDNYYPVPIPLGATSMIVTMPSALYVGVRTCHWTGTQYDGDYGSSWTDSASATFDVSSYNDGTYFATATFKVGTAGTTDMRNYDMSGVSVSFA